MMKEKTSPVLPFTIVRDVNESAPYHFTGIPSDASDNCNGLPWVVPIVTKSLWSMGRIPIALDLLKEPVLKGYADYSIQGMEHLISIERKSLTDLYSTLGSRRYEFECEIARLSRLEFAAVVIEADWNTILFDPPASSRLNPKTVSRTVLSWSIRYPNVHWFTCVDRRHGELTTFQLLRQFWKQQQKRDSWNR